MPYLDLIFIPIFALYVYWIWGLLRALSSDAPYVPIRHEVLQRMLAMASPKPDAVWVDLGSGDGRILIEACRTFPTIRGVGIERIRPLRWYARLNILIAGLSRRLTIRGGDFFTADLSGADIVSFYLLPETNKRLISKLQKELKPGAQVIFHRHPVPGLQLAAEDTDYRIYTYIVL
ncbi:MAG: SAM-dependent methyltransferase [Patescibacteria group bacterium]